MKKKRKSTMKNEVIKITISKFLFIKLLFAIKIEFLEQFFLRIKCNIKKKYQIF